MARALQFEAIRREQRRDGGRDAAARVDELEQAVEPVAACRHLRDRWAVCGVCAILVRSSLSRDPVQNRFRDLVEISKFLFGEAKSLEISFAPGRPQISKRISRDPWIRQAVTVTRLPRGTHDFSLIRPSSSLYRSPSSGLVFFLLIEEMRTSRHTHPTATQCPRKGH